MPIPVTGGLVLQLETDSGVTISGGKVTAWRDSSGKANHLVGAGDPALSGTTPTGAPVIDFDGAGDKLERALGLNGLPAGNQNRTVFFVVDYINPQGVFAGAVFGDDETNQTFGLTAAGASGNLAVQGYGGANDHASGTNGVAGGFLVQSAVLANGTLKQYKNGGLIDTDSHNFNTDLQKLVLGEEIGGKGFAALKVGAMIVFDRALSEGERGQVEAYLQQKYLGDLGNVVPVANDDTLNIAAKATGTINVLTNDSDDAPLKGSMISIVDGPDKGTITGINQNTGVITYKHTGSGDDSFTYKLTDAKGAVSNVATVTVDVPGGGTTGPLSLEGFSDELVINRAAMGSGGNNFQPISMAFTADNRMLLVSKTGEIRIVDPETGANAVLMKLTNIDQGQERGLLDITLDPNFETNGHFYLYYTPASPQHARISRFTFQENSGGLTSKASPSSELKIWEDTDGYLACCHYGGGLDFGIDGKIWLTTSDKFQATTPGEGATGGEDLPLDLTSSSGKVIRINKDGSIPNDNPFKDGPGGNDDSIWAYGLRNPFRARWDAEYGHMYIGEVGGNQQTKAHEDLHLAGLGQKGAFYGWPFYEGTPNVPVNGGASPKNPNNFPAPDNDLANPGQGDFFSAPIWSLPHNGLPVENNLSASLTGGEVYRGDMFPEAWDGVYFYGDYTRDLIRYLVLNADGTKVLGDFAFKPSAGLPGATNEVVSITVGADGALYYAMISSGQVRRVVFEEDNAAPDIVATALTPQQGNLPLAVTFTATVTDADGDTMTWTVNFGDGTTKTGTVPANGLISVTHTYTKNGDFDVALSVTDGDSTSLSAPIEVVAGEVNDAPVIANEGSDLAVGGAGTTEITFTAKVTDADGDSMSYVWNFGDGTTAIGTVGANGIVTAKHIYPDEGTYQAFLEVTDGSETTASDLLPIQIGTATQVPITNGLVLLLQSDIKIGLGDGNTVAAWLDGSGNGNNLFAQGNPQLLDDQTPTGQPAIVFDGTGDLLQRVNATDTIFNLPTGNADRTVFVVVDYVNPEGVSAGVVYGDGAGNEAFGAVADKNGNLSVQGYGGANDFPSGTNGVTGGFLVQSVVLKGGVTSHYKNGVLIDTDSHTFQTDLQKLLLGAEIKGAGEAQMKIGAVLIYDRAISATERGLIEDFLQTKYITGAPTQVAPVAGNDTATTTHAVAVTVDVLANDTDGNSDPLTITAVTAGANGTAVITRNGTPGNPADDKIVYTPNSGFVGSDSFTYTIGDGHGNFDTATVTVNITGTVPNTPPVAVDDDVTTGLGTAVEIAVLGNDSDANGDMLAITGLLTPAHGTVVVHNNGTPTNTADDRIIYTPNAGFTGADAFTYTIADGKGGTATATVNVTVTGPTTGVPVTSGLVAAYQADENVSLGAGSTVTGWLDGSGRGNDLVANGNPQLAAAATPTGQAAIVFDGTGDLLQRINATDTLSGFAAGAADRTIFFVVDYVNPEGVTSGIAYGDGARNETFGLVAGTDGKLTVQGYGAANDLKSGSDGVAGGFLVQSVVLKGNVASHYKNGVLIDQDPHVFATDLQKLILGAEIKGAGESQLKISAVLIYNRALSAAELVQTETYLQNKYVTLTAPVAVDDAFTLAEDTPFSGNVLVDNGAGADSDPNGDPLTVTLVADAGHGTLALGPNGDFSYTPDADFFGSDSFDYNISDGKGGTDRATVTLTVTPVDDPAVAEDDAYAAVPGTTLTVAAATGLLANDRDPDGDALTATLTTGVAHGTLALNANGSFSYTPAAGFTGTDSFVYAVPGGDTATVTLEVGAPELVTAGLVARFESDGIARGAGSAVTGWNDASGKANHLAAGGNPTVAVDATPTGEDAVAFDGVGDVLSRVHAVNPLKGFVKNAADRTMFLVVDYADPKDVTSGLVYGEGTKNQAFGLVAGKNGALTVNGFGAANDFDSGVDGVTGGFLVQSVVLDDNVISHYLDGALIDTDSHVFKTDMKKLILGGAISNAGQSEMEIAAALVYNRALTEPERLDVEAYLQQKYIGGDDLFG